MQSRLRALAALAVALGACSSPASPAESTAHNLLPVADGGAPDSSLGTPTVEFVDPDHPTCTTSDLGGACDGSYEYRLHNLCTDAQMTEQRLYPDVPKSPIVHMCPSGGLCETSRTCRHVSNGMEPAPDREYVIPRSTVCNVVCADAEPPEDPARCRSWRQVCSVQPPCWGSQGESRARAQLAEEGEPREAYANIRGIAGTREGRCVVRVTGIQRAISAPNVACGCAECRHSSCGTESTYRYSTRASLPFGGARTAAECTTAELVTSGSNERAPTPEERLARLKTSWTERPALPAADRNRVAARIRTMLELHADLLPASVRSAPRAGGPASEPWALEAFLRGTADSDLTCEVPSVAVSIPAACPALQRDAITERLHLCERVPQHPAGRSARTTPSVARLLVEDCLNMLDRLDANPSCSNDSIAQRARVAAYRVALLATDALASSTLPVVNVSAPSGAPAGDYATIPELARQLRVIDRWFAHALASEAAVPAATPGWTHSHLDSLLAATWRRARAARRVTESLCPNLGSTDANGDCIVDSEPDAGAVVVADAEEDSPLVSALTQVAARVDLLQRHMLLAAYQETQIPALRIGSIEALPAVPISTTPLHGEPLLVVTADALSGFESRLDALAPYHQFACRLGICGERSSSGAIDWARQPAWAQAWALMANLDDEAVSAGDPFDFATMVRIVGPSFASPGATQPQSWQSVFQRITRRQSVLEAAVDLATGEATAPAAEQRDLPAANLSNLAPGAVPLAALVRRSDRSASAFAASGLADPSVSRHELETIVSEDGREAMIDAVELAIANLDRGITSFERDRRDVVSDLLTRLATQQTEDEVEDRRADLAREVVRVSDERLAFEETLRQYEMRYADAADAMAMLGGSLDQGGFIPVGDTRRFEVRGHDARSGTNGLFNRLEYVGARGLEVGGATPADPAVVTRVEVPANHLVALHIEGVYSPLCALRSYRVHVPGADAPGDSLPVTVAPGTTIGPEGFVITHSGTESQVRSVGDPGMGADAERIVGGLCGVATAVAAAYTGGGSTAGLELARKTGVVNGACGALSPALSWLTGEQIDPVRHSDSAEASSSVRFQAGLRLQNTPFPTLPAGALMVLEVPRGETLDRDGSRVHLERVADAVDVHLLHPGNSSFLVRDDADLYFVINDAFISPETCGDLSPVDDRNRIQIELRLLESQTAATERVVTSMGNVLARLREDREEIIAQGAFLGTQQTAYRHQALSDVQTQTGGAFGDLPETVRNLFDTYVSYELARMEIMTEVAARNRRVSELQTQLEALDDDLEAAQQGKRHVELLPLNTFRTIDEYSNGTDEAHLRSQADALMRLVTLDLLPLIELWHPDVLQRLFVDQSQQREALLDRLTRLANAGPDIDPTSLVDDVLFVARAIVAAYRTSPMTHLDADRYTVGLSFPRPGAVFQPEGSLFSSGYPRASAQLSQQVWNAAFAARALLPSDVSCANTSECTARFGPGVTCSERRCAGTIACVDTNDEDTEANECAVASGSTWTPLRGLVCETGACVRGPTSARITLQPSDLYRQGSGGGHVHCQNAAPIVERSALVFALGAQFNSTIATTLESMSTAGRTALGSMLPRQIFALRDEARSYTQLDARFLERQIPLVYTFTERVTPDFGRFTRPSAGHRGSSAFTTISIDFAPLRTFGDRNGIDGTYAADEIILAMEIDAVPSTALSWIAPCAPPAPRPPATVPVRDTTGGGITTDPSDEAEM